VSGRQRPRVLRPDELPTTDRGGGARTVPLVTSARGATTFLNGMTDFDPGAAIAHHRHNVAESVVVLTGEAIVDIDGERTRLRVHDATFVPAGIPHHFQNASATEPMRILWTYGSPDATRTLLDYGQERRIDTEHANTEHADVEPLGDEPVRLVREVARFTVLPGCGEAFERAVAEAVPLFRRAAGARTLVLEQVEENPLEYRLVVGWESVADHMTGFRGSADFARWRELISDTVAGPAEVVHVRAVLTGL
jgi:quercetin dioxygenase-like cupin family protein/quinol monooxygenase YgiN